MYFRSSYNTSMVPPESRSMESLESLREFVTERLAAAAEDIFVLFQRRIEQYEEEIDRQRRLLEHPAPVIITSLRADVPQQPVCKEEDVTEQHLCKQEGESSLGREDPEPPQVKEELCSSQEEEQIVQTRETGTCMKTPPCEERDHSQPELQNQPQILAFYACAPDDQDSSGNEDSTETQAAAAEDPSEGFNGSISKSKGDIDSQYRLLDYFWQPQVSLTKIDVPPVCKEKAWTEQKLCNQGRESSLDPEPSQVTKKEEELRSSQEEEQIKEIKQLQGTNTLGRTPVERDHSEPELHNERPNLQGKASTSSQTLNVHTRNQEDQKLNSFRTHGNTFPSRSSPQDHTRTHTGETLYPCKTCGKSFRYKKSLTNHERTHTEKSHPCETSVKDFKSKSTREIHMRSHTGERPCSCTTCGKAFPSRGEVKRHMKIHTGEKPYPCGTCEKAFIFRSELEFHSRSHTGERPYSCTICGKAFSRRSKVTRHMKIHTEEKPYPCGTCEKAFISTSKLEVHTRSHTGERPYSCTTCGKAFPGRWKLERHMRIHTEEQP